MSHDISQKLSVHTHLGMLTFTGGEARIDAHRFFECIIQLIDKEGHGHVKMIIDERAFIYKANSDSIRIESIKE